MMLWRFTILALLALPAGAAAAQTTNHLANEKSPYLQLHAHNPVDWYPWGNAAFEKAKQENKPVFLSIGYSTCHWCHVMEQESFSDPLVGKMMNATFVSIKVDREERPDIDALYMTVSQLLTGGGGWPLNVLMTPDKKPFFAATYLPKEDRLGLTGLTTLIPRVAQGWSENRDEIDQSAEKITAALRKHVSGSPGAALKKETLRAAYDQLVARFDPIRGGFLPAPKFPSPHELLFLLRYWKRFGDAKALQIVEKTLDAMRRGGIFDQVGFGFHRYSTDAEWLVPHFEKMLYDQAMLAMAYTEAYQATHKAEYRQTAEQVFTYVLRDMRAPNGGFYSAEDADSEGKEGKFYLWTESEIRAVVGADADLVIAAFGTNILHLVAPPASAGAAKRLEAARVKLFAARDKRIHPPKDDKILTDWNGLMIAALAQAGDVFDEPSYVDAAKRAAEFVLTTLRGKDGHLLHRYRDGEAAIPAKLDDAAFLTWGLLNLYQSTFDIRYLQMAIDLQTDVLQRFWDDTRGAFFLTASDSEPLLVRPKQSYDGAMPSGNSAELMNLIRLARMTGNPEYETRAEKLVRAFSGDVTRTPSGFTYLLSGVDFALGPSFEIVLAGKLDAADTRRMRRAVASRFIPNKVVLFRPAAEAAPPITRIAAFTKPQLAIHNRATAYVCTNFACKLPTNDAAVMVKLLTSH